MVSSTLSIGSVARLYNVETNEYAEYFVLDNNGGFVEILPLESGVTSIVLSHETLNTQYELKSITEIDWSETEE
jgi:hypothetical protein